MQTAVAVFIAFCAWLFSPVYIARMRHLELADVGNWGGVGESQPGLPAAWRGAYFLRGNAQPDGKPSPLVGMDLSLCAFDAVTRSLSCPVSSMLWAARDDATAAARQLAAARFVYVLEFDPAYRAASMRARVFGMDVLPRIGLVWDCLLYTSPSPRD